MERGADFAISLRIAGTCNRDLGQELWEDEEKLREDLARDAKVSESDAWKRSKACDPFKEGDISNGVVSTGWVLAGKMVDGRLRVDAPLVTKAYQNPDLKNSSVDTLGLVSGRHLHLQVISFGTLKKNDLGP